MVAVACLVSLGAGGDTDTAEHRSYPASHLFLIEEGSEQWQDVVPMLRAKLHADSADRDSKATPADLRSARGWRIQSGELPIESINWYRVEPNGVFDEAVPSLELYLGDRGVNSQSGEPMEKLMAVRDSVVYCLPGALNQLLHDAGVLLDSTREGEWARMAALLWCGEHRDRLTLYCHGLREQDDDWRQPYFPPVTFEGVDLERENMYGRGTVRVRVWGKSVSLELQTVPWLIDDGRLGTFPVRVRGPEELRDIWTDFGSWQ